MRYLVLALVALFIAGCSTKNGYKPTAVYSADIFDTPVLTKVKMDAEDPDIGVYLEDEIARMATNRLNLTLTKNIKEAKGYILVNKYTINTTAMNTDSNGSVVRYSVNAAMQFAIKDRHGFWSKNIVASEYVTVAPQSLVSTLEKDKASRVAIQKALDEFVMSVMQRSRKVGENKSEMPKESDNSEQDNTDVDNTTNSSLVETTNSVTENDTNTDNTIIENDTSSYEDITTDSNDANLNDNSNYNDSSMNSVFESDSTTNSMQNDSGNTDIKIIPVDDGEALIKDATIYN